MGNFGKKMVGFGILGAAAGAAVYYFQKKKEENPDLQEEFADFQDNVKETAASAVNVAVKLKEAVEKSVDDAVSKVKEHTDDFVDEDIFEEEDTDLGDDFSDLAEDVKKGVLEPEAVTEETISDYLDTRGLPDPDLLIRTSGEERLSNFLMWQLAYTEFYFTDVAWPEFDKAEFARAIEKYNQRDRRYGGVKEESHV